MRTVKKKVLTVVLDMELEAHHEKLSDERYVIRSQSTRVCEVKDAGKPEEKVLPDGTLFVSIDVVTETLDNKVSSIGAHQVHVRNSVMEGARPQGSSSAAPSRASLYRRFPDHVATIELLIKDCERFPELCDDYLECGKVLRRLS